MTNMFTQLRILFRHFTRRERQILLVLPPLLALATSLDVVCIGLLLPFMAYLQGPTESKSAHSWIYGLFDDIAPARSSTTLIVVAMLLFALFAFKSVCQAGIWLVTYRAIYRMAARFGTLLLGKFIRRPYEVHLNTNSSVVISHVTQQIMHVFASILIPAIYLGTEATVLSAIVVLLVSISPIPAVATLSLLTVTALIMTRTLRSAIQKSAHQYIECEASKLRWASQGLAGIKELKVMSEEPFFEQRFDRASRRFADAQMFNSFLSKVPRWIAEPMVVLAFGTFLTVSVMRRNHAEAAPLAELAVFGMAALRLVPSFSTINVMLNKIRFSLPALELIAREFQDNPADPPPLSGNVPVEASPGTSQLSCIQLVDVGHSYRESPHHVLSSVSLTINTGDRVAIVGESGSGKTTLLNILLGLITPSEGCIRASDESGLTTSGVWRHQVGFVPQEIFLFDDTIRSNICLSRAPQENDRDLWDVLERTQLANFVKGLPNGLDTVVGERGARISGGQRQRIGIARALFRHPQLLVMDEPTSALDSQTERELLDFLLSEANPCRTIVMVTHRLDVASRFDRILHISDGRVLELSGTLPRVPSAAQQPARQHLSPQ